MPNSKNTSLLCLKLVLLTSGVVSMSIILINLFIPLLSQAIPTILNSLYGWLKPHYLYFIINAIIICIAASSRFQNMHEPELEMDTVLDVPLRENIVAMELEARFIKEEEEKEKEMSVKFEEKSVVFVSESKDSNCESDGTGESFKDEFCFPAQKPPVSARFDHRKPFKVSPQGERKLEVSKPKRQDQHDTLENTWKMITEGKAKPVTKQVIRIDTWENEGHEMMMKKSETFKDRNVPAVKLRKEPSLGQEELNKRVEAFINKFNEDMRIQRQQSLGQYGMLVNKE